MQNSTSKKKTKSHLSQHKQVETLTPFTKKMNPRNKARKEKFGKLSQMEYNMTIFNGKPTKDKQKLKVRRKN